MSWSLLDRVVIILGEMNGSVSTSIRGVRFTPYIPGGNEWVRFPRHSVSGSTLLGLTWDSWCGKGTAPGCAWCLRGAMLLRGFRLFGVALHREPKGTKRQIWQTRLTMVIRQTLVPACLDGRRLAAMTLPRLGQLNLPGRTNQTWMTLPVRAGPKESSL